MPNKPARRLGVALVLMCLTGSAAVYDGAPAHAQDRTTEEVALEADIEAKLLRLRNHLALRKYPPRVQAAVRELLNFRHPRALAGLRVILGETATDETIVEQIILVTLTDSSHRLLPDVVDRLVKEHGSALDGKLARPLEDYSDAALISKLSALAADPDRRTSFRVECVRTVGRTGKEAALDALLRIWASPEPALQEAAAAAFDRVLPLGLERREDAAAFVEKMKQTETTLMAVLRNLARDRAPGEAPAPGEAAAVHAKLRAAYITLGLAQVETSSFDTLLKHYLRSPLPVLRAAGVEQISAHPFDRIENADEKRRTMERAGTACLAQFADEPEPAIRLALLEALDKVVVEVRGRVNTRAMDSLLTVVDTRDEASRDLRRSAVRFLGRLQDPRALGLLQQSFDGMDDADWETRQDILDALYEIVGGSLSEWLGQRVGEETDDRITERMVFLLGKGEDVAAVAPLRTVRETHATDRVRWKAAQALARLWDFHERHGAREGLLDGLDDRDEQVRLVCAESLSHPGADNDATIERLRDVVGRDASAAVQSAAATSILELDEEDGVRNLMHAFAKDPIWTLYLKRVMDHAVRTESPARALADARLLLEQAEDVLQQRALTMMREVAVARDTVEEPNRLWEGAAPAEGASVRGVVREALARVLLDRGETAEAREWVEQLLATPEREDDPRDRWELLLARVLRESGGDEDVQESRRRLLDLRTRAGVPTDLLPEILVELGHTLLATGDPTFARDVLGGAVTASEGKLRKRAEALHADAVKRSQAEREHVFRLVSNLTREDPATVDSAGTELAALGALAAVHLRAALEGPRDADYTLALIHASSHVVKRNFEVRRGENGEFEDLTAVVADVKRTLGAMIDESRKR